MFDNDNLVKVRDICLRLLRVCILSKKIYVRERESLRKLNKLSKKTRLISVILSFFNHFPEKVPFFLFLFFFFLDLVLSCPVCWSWSDPPSRIVPYLLISVLLNPGFGMHFPYMFSLTFAASHLTVSLRIKCSDSFSTPNHGFSMLFGLIRVSFGAFKGVPFFQSFNLTTVHVWNN
jgi:hypothetical protein